MATTFAGGHIAKSLREVRAAMWGVTAVADAGLSGAEFVLMRIHDAMRKGTLRPTMAAEAAEEARRLLQLDADK